MSNIEGLNFIPIGGCSEIGMNLYAYIYDNQWILVDMGMGFDTELGRSLIIPSPGELAKNKSKIKALFVTHSHEDHIGAIPYLWPEIECPIYARPFAVEMIRDKLAKSELDKKVPMIKVSLNNKISVGPFTVEFIHVAHSTPESSALAITTPEGTILHSGDWRMDDNPVFGSKTDEKKLKEYGDNGVLALCCDSTNVFKDQQSEAESDVRKNLSELVKKYPKSRILITCFASNLARLESCYLAAKNSGRQMVISGRSLKKIERIAKLSGYLPEIPAFLDDKKTNLADPSKILLVCTGSQGEVNSALSKMAADTHKTIKLRNDDIMIFSSRIIPGNEKAVIEIQNALVERGVKIITNLDYEVHASGHPSRNELQRLYELTKPHTLIPIHGGKLHLYRHAEIAEEYGIKDVIIPSDGDIIRISRKKKSENTGSIPVGTLAVDGCRLIPTQGNVYRQREALSSNGIVSICLKCSRGSAELADMTCLGIFEESERTETEDIRSDLASEIRLSLGGLSKDKHSDRLKTTAEKLVKNIFSEVTGKKPVVTVHIVD